MPRRYVLTLFSHFLRFTKCLGYYCESGATSATPCPERYYADSTGGRSINDCIECEDGFLCPIGSTESKILCHPGYYCKKGLATLCDIGYECPEGATEQLECDPGFFNSLVGAASCHGLKYLKKINVNQCN